MWAQEAGLPTVDLAFDSPEALDAAARYHFVIMSDHKGMAPEGEMAPTWEDWGNLIHIQRGISWIEAQHPAFVVGMGDHLKIGWGNPWIEWVRQRPWWMRSFWPNIADGENEYYGNGQSDWGAGGQYLIDTGVHLRPNVEIAPGGCEYHARIAVPGGTVHLLQCYYADQPSNPHNAWAPSSRQWLMERLAAIEKGPGDLVIVGAHSHNGDCLSVLSEGRRRVILERADLVLSATTHHYERHEYGAGQALCINTGSLGFAGQGGNGYVTVHMLDEPEGMLVQYVSTEEEARLLAPPKRCFFVAEDGRTYLADLGTGTP
jgi:hypothetical protein